MWWWVLLLAAASAALVWGVLRSRNLQIWILPWLVGKLRPRAKASADEDVHVYFCFVDHYEPYEGGQDAQDARARVARWLEEYPELAKAHTDSLGRHPQHSFFYPEEEYDPELLDLLARFPEQDIGDVEVHLHHDRDNAGNLLRLLREFKTTLFEKHGFLRKDPATGEILFAFVHGNWALDNSAADGRYCGVDNELEVLLAAGCRVDMTMPSAPSETQAKIINAIYAARSYPGRRKSYDRGRLLRVGDALQPGELLMVQGPLTLDWGSRKFGLLPRVESAEISFDAPPKPERVRLWLDCGICLPGAENHLFIKVHTHGAQKSAMRMLFDQGGFTRLWSALEQEIKNRRGYQLHYVTAWQLVGKIHELMRAGSLEEQAG